MIKTIGIIGGDLRIIRLAEILAKEEYMLYTYGLEQYNFTSSNIIKNNNIEDIVSNCKYIISGIPFSKDGEHIETSFSDKQINIEDVFKTIGNRILITGGISNQIAKIANSKNINMIDLLEFEEFTVLNVVPTVEGAIQIAMEETEYTLNGSKCLILGFGRIGKLLAKSLNALGAKVSCVARKEKDIAWINAYGYNAARLNELDKELRNKYDIVFNTVPAMILDSNKLELVKDYYPLIIELASKPWGIDFEKAKELEIKTIKASGLPGKVAPLTSAINIKNILQFSLIK